MLRSRQRKIFFANFKIVYLKLLYNIKSYGYTTKMSKTSNYGNNYDDIENLEI